MADIFDKLKQGVEKGISAVNLKSKEVVSSLKVKMDIDALERQIVTATTRLGEVVYTMNIQQAFDQEKIKEQCGEISLLKNQLAEKEKELGQIRFETGEALGKIYCSQCKEEISEDSKYCPKCGAKVN